MFGEACATSSTFFLRGLFGVVLGVEVPSADNSFMVGLEPYCTVRGFSLLAGFVIRTVVASAVDALRQAVLVVFSLSAFAAFRAKWFTGFGTYVSPVPDCKAFSAELSSGSVWTAAVFASGIDHVTGDVGAHKGDNCGASFAHHASRGDGVSGGG